MKNIEISIITLSFCIISLLIAIPQVFSESIEKDVSEISKELMCPVCRGQTVAESNSTLANDFREIIKKKLEAGESKEEILNYFINRYGESVLASPPAKGIRIIVWFAPILAIIIGFFILVKFIRSRNVSTDRNDPIYDDENKYLNKVDDEIDKLKL